MTTLSTGDILNKIKELQRVSFSGLCKSLEVNPDSEDTRPRFWRLSQGLATLIRFKWIEVDYVRGERIYTYLAG